MGFIKMNLLKFAFVVFSSLYSFFSYASVESDIKSAFTEYWKYYSCGNYSAASKIMHPLDLEEARVHVLPILLNKQSSKDAEVRKFVQIFFSANSKKDPRSFNGTDMYLGLSKVFGLGNDVISAMCSSKIYSLQVLSTQTSGKVTYKVRLKSGEIIDGGSEILGKYKGKWFIKMSTPPAQAAIELEQHLSRKI